MQNTLLTFLVVAMGCLTEVRVSLLRDICSADITLNGATATYHLVAPLCLVELHFTIVTCAQQSLGHLLLNGESHRLGLLHLIAREIWMTLLAALSTGTFAASWTHQLGHLWVQLKACRTTVTPNNIQLACTCNQRLFLESLLILVP